MKPMDCDEARNMMALRLSGESGDDVTHDLSRHIRGCPTCRAEMEQQEMNDRTLREAFAAQRLDAGALQERVRRQIRADEVRRPASSVFLFCKYAVPHMPEGGAIVNISSVHAHETTKNVVLYATSKGGMEAFTRGFSEELAERKIRINCIAPGAVDTPMLWNNPNVKSGAEKVEGAIGEPDDIAAAILFLAADEARFITGTTLVVDGGRLDIL